MKDPLVLLQEIEEIEKLEVEVASNPVPNEKGLQEKKRKLHSNLDRIVKYWVRRVEAGSVLLHDIVNQALVLLLSVLEQSSIDKPLMFDTTRFSYHRVYLPNACKGVFNPNISVRLHQGYAL